MFDIRFSKEAVKGVEKLSLKHRNKLKRILIHTIADNPYQGKKLVGDLKDFYSCRLNLKDRIVYTIDEKRKIVFIHRAKTHYED